MDAYRVALHTMTSSKAAANAPCPITYARTHIGTSALASANAINPVLWRHEPAKPAAAASIASAPRVGVTIAAAPAANPATSGCHRRRCGFATLAGTGQAATMESSVVSQWWLICVQGPCDMPAHPTATSGEAVACPDAGRQGR